MFPALTSTSTKCGDKPNKRCLAIFWSHMHEISNYKCEECVWDLNRCFVCCFLSTSVGYNTVAVEHICTELTNTSVRIKLLPGFHSYSSNNFPSCILLIFLKWRNVYLFLKGQFVENLKQKRKKGFQSFCFTLVVLKCIFPVLSIGCFLDHLHTFLSWECLVPNIGPVCAL